MTHTYIFEGTMTALTSISHIGEQHGIRSMLRRERVMQPDGTTEEIPIISGNGLRGMLRDRGMIHMLRCLGYGVDEETGECMGLSKEAFYFLLSGGALTSDSSRGLDIEEARRWREIIPLVSIFGGAMGNQIMEGKAKIGKAIPICAETKHLLPERFSDNGDTPTIWEMLQEEAYTRRDDLKRETMRQLVKPEILALEDKAAAGKRKVRGTDKEVADDPGTAQQMRYYVETIAAGTKLFWDVVLDDVTDLEFEAFCVTLAEFSRMPYVGGKSAVGLGKVQINFDDWIEINPRLAPEGRAVGFTLGNLYENHLQEHGDEIRELLDGLS